MLYHIKT